MIFTKDAFIFACLLTLFFALVEVTCNITARMGHIEKKIASTDELERLCIEYDHAGNADNVV